MRYSIDVGVPDICARRSSARTRSASRGSRSFAQSSVSSARKSVGSYPVIAENCGLMYEGTYRPDPGSDSSYVYVAAVRASTRVRNRSSASICSVMSMMNPCHMGRPPSSVTSSARSRTQCVRPSAPMKR